MTFLLTGGTAVNPQTAFRANIRISGTRIVEVAEGLRPRTNELVLDCTDQYLFPGLINAHDHLSFNLFPRLGDPPYPNSYEWGNQIRSKYKSTIDPIVRIPLRHRLYWGAWKNLFSGVTTVVHHDPYFLDFRLGYPVNVFPRYTFAHSLGFERDMGAVLQKRRESTPFIIHLAEGTDQRAAGEVESLSELGGLDSRTVAVHAVGIQQTDVETLQKAQTSVVWCPASNYFLFNTTAPLDNLRGKVGIAIGTDSTITGSSSLFEELRSAQRGRSLTPQELFGMVTDSPRRIFGLQHDAGAIVKEGRADLFVLSASDVTPYSALLHAKPGDITLLFRRGKVLFHDACFDKCFRHDRTSEPRVTLNGKVKWIASRRFSKRFQTYRAFLHQYSYLN